MYYCKYVSLFNAYLFKAYLFRQHLIHTIAILLSFAELLPHCRCITCGGQWQAASRTTSRTPKPMATAPSTPWWLGMTASRWRSKSGLPRCTSLLSMALRRTGVTRRSSAVMVTRAITWQNAMQVSILSSCCSLLTFSNTNTQSCYVFENPGADAGWMS